MDTILDRTLLASNVIAKNLNIKHIISSLIEIMGTDIKEFVRQEIKKQNDKFIREFISNFSNESKYFKYKYKYKYKHKRKNK